MRESWLLGVLFTIYGTCSFRLCALQSKSPYTGCHQTQHAYILMLRTSLVRTSLITLHRFWKCSEMLLRKIKRKNSQITNFFIIRSDFIYSNNVQLGSLLLELEILKDWFHQQFIASLENEGGLGKEAFQKRICL